MIKIKILKKDNKIYGFEISGHSGYSQIGSDIVCSAVSSIALTTCLGITKVLKINSQIEKDDEKGYLKLVLEKNTKNKDLLNAQILFETMIIGLDEIRKDYKKYVKMEENYEVF